jgi:hypothetical protein
MPNYTINPWFACYNGRDAVPPILSGPQWAVALWWATVDGRECPQPREIDRIGLSKPDALRRLLYVRREYRFRSNAYDFREKRMITGVYANYGRMKKVLDFDPEFGTPGAGYGAYDPDPDQTEVASVYPRAEMVCFAADMVANLYREWAERTIAFGRQDRGTVFARLILHAIQL